MLRKSISPAAWLVECQVMCLIHSSLNEGVSSALPLRSLICVEVKCSRNIILRAKMCQNKGWKIYKPRPGLHPQRSWTPTLKGWMGPCSPCVPHGGSWSLFLSCLLATATAMPGDGAASTVPWLPCSWPRRWDGLWTSREPSWALVPSEPPLRVATWHLNSAQSCTSPLCSSFLP